MNNRERVPPHPPAQSALVRHPLVDHEGYLRAKAQLEVARSHLEAYARNLESGYQEFVSQEQDLRRRVEEGRQAEHLLTQLQSAGRNLQALPAPSPRSSPVVPAGTFGQSSSLPTGVPPGRNAAAGGPSFFGRPSRSAAPLANQAVYATSQTVPQPTRSYYHETPSASTQMPQQLHYENQEPRPASSYSGPTILSYSQLGANNGNAPVRASDTPQSAHLSVHEQQSPQAPSNGSPRQNPVIMTQQSMFTSTAGSSSLDGAMGNTNAGRGITHAKVTYSTQKHKSSSETYDNIFDILKGLRPAMVDYIILLVLDSLGTKLPSASIKNETLQKIRLQLPNTTYENVEQIKTYVVNQLKALDSDKIMQIIVRIKKNVKENHQPLPPRSGNGAPGGPIHPARDQAGIPEMLPRPSQLVNTTTNNHSPSSSVLNPGPPPVVPSAVAAQEGTMNIPIHPPSPVTQPTAPPSWEPTFRAVVSGRPGSNQSGAKSFLHSGTLAANGGQTHIVSPSLHIDVPASLSSSNNPPPSQTRACALSASQAITPSTPTRDGLALEAPARPTNHWTPAKANKTRLAQDIMRSLGRPSRTNTAPESVGRTAIDPMHLSLPQQVMEGPKRKTPPSASTSPAAHKKQKVVGREVFDVEEITTDGAKELAVWQRVHVENASATVDDVDITNGLYHLRVEEGATKSHEQSTSERVATPADHEGANSAAPSIPKFSPEIAASSQDIRTLAATQEPPFEQRSSHLPEETSLEADVPDARIPSEPKSPETSASVPPTSSTPSPVTNPFESLHMSGSHAPATQAEAGPSMPLFLPSPPASQVVVQVSDKDVDADQDIQSGKFVLDTDLLGPGPASMTFSPIKYKGKRRATQPDNEAVPSIEASHQSQPFYIAVPPLPRWAQRLKMKNGERPILRQRSIIDVDALSDGQSQSGQDDVVGEQEGTLPEKLHIAAAELSYTRLRELPCRWNGCPAVLNSTMRLIQHAVLHAGDKNTTGSVKCEWLGCGRSFSSKKALVQHLAKHPSTPKYCAYEGCDRAFSSSKELYQHHSSSRQHPGQSLKRTTEPFEPVLLEPPPPLPEVLPAYMVEPRRVSRHPISKERHQWLGAQVLENISAFHYVGRRMHAGAPSRAARQLAQMVAAAEAEGGNAVRHMAHDEYDDLIQETALKSSKRCDDIASAETSQLIDGGLVLFPLAGAAEEDQFGVKAEGDESDLLYEGEPAEMTASSSRAALVPDVSELIASGSDIQDRLGQAGDDVADAVLQAVETLSQRRRESGALNGRPDGLSEAKSVWTDLGKSGMQEEEVVESLL